MPMAATENTERRVVSVSLPADVIGLVEIEQTIDRRPSFTNATEMLLVEAINARRRARGEPPIGADDTERGNGDDET